MVYCLRSFLRELSCINLSILKIANLKAASSYMKINQSDLNLNQLSNLLFKD